MVFLAALVALSLLVGCGQNASAPKPADTKPAAGGQQPATGGSGGSASSGGPSGPTLDKIKARGKLIAGVKYDAKPFGYLDTADNQVKGYDVDVARAIAKKIFGDENKIELKQVKSADRIPALQQGDVDIVVATMTINEERKKQIDFSDVYYMAGMSLLVKKGSPIKGVKDLEGKTVATAKGANSGPNLQKIAEQQKVKFKLDSYDTYDDALKALQAGRADAIVSDNTILFGMKLTDPNTELVGGLLTEEPYGIGVKKGSDDLLKLVNDVIKELKSSGQADKLIEKWGLK